MIQENELRIGNWVEHDKRHFKIDSISNVFPTLDTIEFGIGVVDWNNINGILLTKEILLKCPKIKFNPISIITKNYNIDLGRGRFLSLNDIGLGNEMIAITNREDKKVSDVVIIHNRDYDGRIAVHKFQNIVFALTGKELEIDFNQPSHGSAK
jgi:hypothetical protein